jgi:hypothetical protein
VLPAADVLSPPTVGPAVAAPWALPPPEPPLPLPPPDCAIAAPVTPIVAPAVSAIKSLNPVVLIFFLVDQVHHRSARISHSRCVTQNAIWYMACCMLAL